MKSKTNPKTQRLSLRIRIHLRLRRIRRRRLVRPRREAPAGLSEENDLFLSLYKQEMESSTLERSGLDIPLVRFSYREERIGGQNILPKVLNQRDTHLCHFLATTACVEARYRLYLARTQNDFQYGGLEGGGRQPSSFFEQLSWHSWIPRDFHTPSGSVTNEGQEWSRLTQTIVTNGIPTEREYCNDFEKPWTHYRAADLNNHTLQCYIKGGVSMKQTSHDWATLTTELKMRGPFVANFKPNEAWYKDEGKSTYYGVQGAADATGHAVLVTGYARNEQGRFFEIMNSYGHQWGSNGFGWVSQECLDWILMPSIVHLDLDRKNI